MPPKETKEKEETTSSSPKGSPKPAKKITKKKPKEKKEAEPSKRYTLDGPRKRKAVDIYTDTTTAKKEKEIVVKKGKGKKLEDCENVATQINKRKRSDEVLATLYGIIYGRVTKKSPIKDHLLQFSGVVYDDDEKGREKLEGKLEKINLNSLREIMIFFGQDPDGKKEEVVDHLAAFLEKPSASDEDFTSKSKKRKRSSSTSRSRSRSGSKSKSKSRSKSPAKKKKKKDPNAPKRPLSSYMLYCQDHRKEVVNDNPKEPVTEIAKILGKMWKKVGATEKKKFEKEAEKRKEKYTQEMKKYKPSKETKTDKKKKVHPKNLKKESKSDASGSESSGKSE